MSQPQQKLTQPESPNLTVVAQENLPEGKEGKDPNNDNALIIENAAGWFYWIAGLSVVNTVLMLFGSDVGFLCGLGITQVVDVLFAAFNNELTSTIGAIISIGLSIFFAICGIFAQKRWGWAFFIGILFYFVDALVVLLLGDFLSLAIHAWILFQLIMGYITFLKD
jgi:hypothetical protein